MIVKKGGIARNIDKKRLHEYKAKGYEPFVMEEVPTEPVPSTDIGTKKQAKKPTAKE